MVPALGLTIFREDRIVEDLQELIKVKMIVENITHDYINRCLKEPGFDLLELSKRIGQTNSYVIRVGSPPSYYPYGYDGFSYTPYFVKYNEFVKEKETSNNVNLVRDTAAKGKMLLVTIQPNRFSKTSLTVLFTDQ